MHFNTLSLSLIVSDLHIVSVPALLVTETCLPVHLYYNALIVLLPSYSYFKKGCHSDISTRQSRHGSITLRCPKYLSETEGGRAFTVTALKEWNKFPINKRSSQSVKDFEKNFANSF